MKFRKKPVVIEAIQWTGQNHDEVFRWIDGVTADHTPRTSVRGGVTLEIDTLEGTMTAQPGDWIVCGVRGELYPCKPDIFAETYEPAE